MKRLWLVAIIPLLLTGCLPVPSGLSVHVSVDGCVGDGSYCTGAPANYYDAPTRAVVLAPDQPIEILVHEICHAHQHAMVLEKNPDSCNLWLYFGTTEGMSYLTYTGQTPSEATLEANAWVCAWWWLDRGQLTPAELAWAEEYLR